MGLTMEASIISRCYTFRTSILSPHFVTCNHQLKQSPRFPPATLLYHPETTYRTGPYILRSSYKSRLQPNNVYNNEPVCSNAAISRSEDETKEYVNLENFGVLVNRFLVLGVLVYSVIRCRRVLAMEGLVSDGYGILARGGVFLRGIWPKIFQVLCVFKEHGFVLAALLGLSAFFSMAETSIMTLWPWKVRELAEKEPENGVFRLLRSDVTRFLTTILIGTTVLNIGATALVTEAATTIFGEAGVSAATGVVTVAILLLSEITPKSIAVHPATEVARFVVRPVAWLSLVLYPVGRVVTFLSMGMLKIPGLKGRSEPNVSEDELKLMLRVAESSGAIEEEEQDMIENVLEIKDTHVREVMTPLIDVVAVDASATLIDFHDFWVTHQYSRVPVFEQRRLII